MMQVDSNRFYDGVPVLHRFADIADLSRYQPLPDDWMLGLPDVVQSTQAIRENRYKAVNMAGAAVIGAVANALGTVFGGDGASFAVPPAESAVTGTAFAEARAWVRDELDLVLRVALIPVSAKCARAGMGIQSMWHASRSRSTFPTQCSHGLIPSP
jgi:Protein of unknown function (DUF3095)